MRRDGLGRLWRRQRRCPLRGCGYGNGKTKKQTNRDEMRKSFHGGFGGDEPSSAAGFMPSGNVSQLDSGGAPQTDTGAA